MLRWILLLLGIGLAVHGYVASRGRVDFEARLMTLRPEDASRFCQRHGRAMVKLEASLEGAPRVLATGLVRPAYTTDSTRRVRRLPVPPEGGWASLSALTGARVRMPAVRGRPLVLKSRARPVDAEKEVEGTERLLAPLFGTDGHVLILSQPFAAADDEARIRWQNSKTPEGLLVRGADLAANCPDLSPQFDEIRGGFRDHLGVEVPGDAFVLLPGDEAQRSPARDSEGTAYVFVSQAEGGLLVRTEPGWPSPANQVTVGEVVVHPASRLEEIARAFELPLPERVGLIHPLSPAEIDERARRADAVPRSLSIGLWLGAASALFILWKRIAFARERRRVARRYAEFSRRRQIEIY